MERSLHWKLSAAAATAVPVGALMIPWLLQACDGLLPTTMGGAVPMRCTYTYRVEFGLALVALAVGGALLWLSSREARRMGGGVLALLGALIAAVPQRWLIGTCRGGTCHSGGLWFAIAGVFLLLMGAQSAVLARE